jgi:hypothetical protein
LTEVTGISSQSPGGKQLTVVPLENPFSRILISLKLSILSATATKDGQKLFSRSSANEHQMKMKNA